MEADDVLSFDRGQRILRGPQAHLITVQRRKLRDPCYVPPHPRYDDSPPPRYA